MKELPPSLATSHKLSILQIFSTGLFICLWGPRYLPLQPASPRQHRPLSSGQTSDTASGCDTGNQSRQSKLPIFFFLFGGVGCVCVCVTLDI